MLSRVARQKNALFHLRKANAYRALGASSHLRLQSSLTRQGPFTSTPNSSTPERRRRPSFQSQRRLATAADPSALDKDSYSLPFEDSWQSAMDQSPFGTAPAFDSSSLIILDEAPQTKPFNIRKVRGVGGDSDEIMANFDMSLKVGKLDRAAALVSRLGQYFPSDSPEYLVFHNRYLLAVVSQAIITRQQEMVPALQKWFEVDMPAAGVKPDATTLAAMIRLSLRMLHGTKKDRSVRRYWDLAKRANLHEDLLAVEVLTDLDLGELSRICYSDLRQPTINMGISEDDLTESPTQKFDDVAEVLAADQKGLGLSSLRKSLSLFSGDVQISMPEGFQGTEEDRELLYSQLRQQRLEADTLTSAIDRWRAEFQQRSKSGSNVTSGKKSVNDMMSQWHTDLVSRIRQELKLADEEEFQPTRARVQKDRAEYSVYLRSLDPERLAAVTILAVMNAFTKAGMDKGIKLASLASTIGRELQEELIADSILKRTASASPGRMKVVKQMLADRNGKEGRMRWKGVSENVKMDDPTLAWTPRIIVRVGVTLMSFLFDVAKTSIQRKDPQTGRRTTSTHSAFLHAYQMTFGKRLGLMHVHPEIVKMVNREPSANIIGRHLPMVCKPKPWTGMREGGYLLYKSNLVRSTPGEVLQPTYLQAALEKDGLEAVRSGLDILGSTGWVINSDVLEVMIEAWNSGEAIGKLAPLEPNLPAPPKPEADAGPMAEKEWHYRMRELENQVSGYHSQRCFQNFQLEVARAFRNETFYLPHNLDFRGRAYPLPPYLNQMGADNARGLLLFSESKPLGVSGLRWLKIQIANLAGFDKASMSEREKFADDHVDDILDSANKGLHGNRWWLKAEDPWQCLAACCELRNALQCPDPIEYRSRLPIHQDGSCNGLQHYAALGGDMIGAQQVNLEPSDRPSDVYTGVSEFVKQKVAEEAAAGDELAQALEGRITRKIVKQTVMTNVYGVTFMGAMRQVRKQLNDHYPDMPSETRKAGSLYIARKIFEALGSMFTGAHDIQYWLGDSASRITQSVSPDQIELFAKEALSLDTDTTDPKASKSRSDVAAGFRSTVIWTTPLGLPVVQPYRTRKARRVYTTMQDLNVVDASSSDVVSKRKQLQAFPPNFIHSLDATHMMLSAIACNKAGLTFSAVHDSFWTHAGDVDSMNHILRDAFVQMHSDDVIGRLAAEFNVRFGNHLFLAKVKHSSAIGKVLRQHRFGKVNAKMMELLEEYRRQKLLRSDDPASQAEGRAMVTAASIFEKMGGNDTDLEIASTLGETGVGHVPTDLAVAERRPDAIIDTSDPAIETLFGDIEMMESKPNDQAIDVNAAQEDADDVASPKGPRRLYTWLWLPLRLRKLPAKGAWDVTRIRDSEYFFS